MPCIQGSDDSDDEAEGEIDSKYNISDGNDVKHVRPVV